MKRLFFLLMVVIPTAAFSQFDMPSYWDMLNKFYSTYSVDETSGHALHFARKKDGWYALLTNPYKSDSVISEQIFWSKQKGRYQVLADFLRADKDPAELKALRYMNGPGAFSYYNYTRCIYYGYNQWDADIIRDYGKADIKNDTLLEGLARAYASYASRYSWYQFGGRAIEGDTLQKSLGRLELPGDARVQKTIENISNAAAAYKKIYDRNKQYETFVGNIDIKLFNEYVHGYLQLSIAGRPKEAAKFLDKCKLPYNDSLAAINLLNSAQPNSIIITTGDLDTYTLMYLQAKHNARKDLAIINETMLGLPAYVEYLRRNNIVAFSTPSSELAKKDIDVSFSYVRNDLPKKIKLEDFIAQYGKLQKMATVDTDSVRVYDATHLYKLYETAEAEGSTKNSLDTFQIKLGRYLALNDFIMLDILNENIQKRYIYFSGEANPFFSEYAIPQGMLKYISIQAPLKPMTDGLLRDQVDYLYKQYVPPFTNYSEFSAEDNYYTTLHLNLYLQLIEYAIEQDEKGQVSAFIKKCFEPFQEKVPFYANPRRLLSVLFQYGHETLGDKMAAAYVKQIMRRNQLKVTADYYGNEYAYSLIEYVKDLLTHYKRGTSYIDEALNKLKQ